MYKLTGYIIRREDGTLPVRCKSNYPPVYDRFDGARRAVQQTNKNHKIFLVELKEISDKGKWYLYNAETGEDHPSVFDSRTEAEDFRDARGWDGSYCEIVLA